MVDGPGLYLLDEPEAALSFRSCLRLAGLMHRVAGEGGQIICATHSPILTGLPGAEIVELGDHGARVNEWAKLPWSTTGAASSPGRTSTCATSSIRRPDPVRHDEN